MKRAVYDFYHFFLVLRGNDCNGYFLRKLPSELVDRAAMTICHRYLGTICRGTDFEWSTGIPQIKMQASQSVLEWSPLRAGAEDVCYIETVVYHGCRPGELNRFPGGCVNRICGAELQCRRRCERSSPCLVLPVNGEFYKIPLHERLFQRFESGQAARCQRIDSTSFSNGLK